MAYATFKPGADDVLFLAAPEKAMTDIANIGRRVHRALFGKPGDGEADANTRAVAGSIAALGTPESAVEPGARMSIEDDGMPFPWGMVYDGDYLTPAGAQRDLMAEQVIPEGFWGHRFTIDRLVRRYGATRAKAQVGGDEVRVRSIVNPTVGTGVLIDGRVTVLPASAAAVAPITSGEALLQWLDAEEGPGEAELVYFYCHGFAAATLDNSGFKKMRTSGEQAVLGIDESETGKVSVQQLRDAAGHPSGNPVVFLTACSAGGGDPGFPSPSPLYSSGVGTAARWSPPTPRCRPYLARPSRRRCSPTSSRAICNWATPLQAPCDGCSTSATRSGSISGCTAGPRSTSGERNDRTHLLESPVTSTSVGAARTSTRTSTKTTPSLPGWSPWAAMALRSCSTVTSLSSPSFRLLRCRDCRPLSCGASTPRWRSTSGWRRAIPSCLTHSPPS